MMVQVTEGEASERYPELPPIQEQIDEIIQVQEDTAREMREMKEALLALVAQGANRSPAVPTRQSVEECQGAAGEPAAAEPQARPRNVVFGRVLPLPSQATREELSQTVADLMRQEREKEKRGKYVYRVPYLPEVHDLPFPSNFKRPDFPRFDGRGSPEEHMAQFMTMMGNLSTIPQYCLRLFGSTITSKAFQWYMSLPVGSVKSWNQMQDLLISKFFSIEQEV